MTKKIDTLKTYDRLKSSGFEDGKAHAFTENLSSHEEVITMFERMNEKFDIKFDYLKSSIENTTWFLATLVILFGITKFFH